MGDWLLAIMLVGGFDYVIRGGGGRCGEVVAGELNCESDLRRHSRCIWWFVGFVVWLPC